MIKTIKKVAVIIITVVIMISTVTIADQASSTTVQAKIRVQWKDL